MFQVLFQSTFSRNGGGFNSVGSSFASAFAYLFSVRHLFSLNCIYFILHGIYQNNDNIGLKIGLCVIFL